MAEAAITHGRHCPCSACAREDWTKITAPCGMHGAACPSVYAPIRKAASGRWQIDLYPHSGRWLVSDGHLAVFGTASIASFARQEDAQAYADAYNEWETTSPSPWDFGGCGPFPKADRYEAGRAIYDIDPASGGPQAASESGWEPADSQCPRCDLHTAHAWGESFWCPGKTAATSFASDEERAHEDIKVLARSFGAWWADQGVVWFASDVALAEAIAKVIGVKLDWRNRVRV